MLKLLPLALLIIATALGLAVSIPTADFATPGICHINPSTVCEVFVSRPPCAAAVLMQTIPRNSENDVPPRDTVWTGEMIHIPTYPSCALGENIRNATIWFG
ncbi:hypothetical protein EDC01DRAFT_628195 [Geopyxis carbonaria]|nr:hypothetical protein EDC01DRAFT_628195 [Geopyxis carbonaria]